MGRNCRMIMIGLLGIAALLRITACGEAPEAAAVTNEAVMMEETKVNMANPFRKCDSLEEAMEAEDFEMSAPESVAGYTEVSYSVMDSSAMIQIRYEQDRDHYIVVRKAKTTEAIDGDYNVYEKDMTETIDGCEVRLRGNGTGISLATWRDGDFAYSVGAYGDNTDEGSGLSAEDMRKIVAEIK